MLKNKINGKIYVGQTIRSIEERFKKHKQKDSRCVALYSAIKLYGWENFKKDWYECPDEDLNFDEELLVREMRTLSPEGYNLREGGGSNGKMSEESKQKIKEGNKGKKRSEETKQKMRKPKSEEHKQNMRKPLSEGQKQKMRKPKSEEHVQNMRGENNHKSRRVYQFHLDGTFINSFGSSGEAGRYLNKFSSSIKACARGDPKYKTAYGFKWSY